jgi:DNA repair protein RadA/Sms
VVVAVASSLKGVPVAPEVFVFGEVGLSGEVRAVGQADLRLKEAAKIGFKKAVIPRSNAERLTNSYGLDISGVLDVTSALESAGL